MKKETAAHPTGESAAELIERKIKKLGDWRGEMLGRLRAIIHAADPGLVETVKWRKPSNPLGVTVWEHGGILCTGETYKDYVKLTFARGASLPDPTNLFNAGFGGGTRRAVDFHEGDKVNEKALKALIHAAVAANLEKGADRKPKKAVKK